MLCTEGSFSSCQKMTKQHCVVTCTSIHLSYIQEYKWVKHKVPFPSRELLSLTYERRKTWQKIDKITLHTTFKYNFSFLLNYFFLLLSKVESMLKRFLFYGKVKPRRKTVKPYSGLYWIVKVGKYSGK